MQADLLRRSTKPEEGLYPSGRVAGRRASSGRFARSMALKPLAALVVLALGPMPWNPVQAATTWYYSAGYGQSVTASFLIHGDDSVVMQGNGTLLMLHEYNYTGGTQVQGGVISIGNGGTDGSIIGDLYGNGTLLFNRSDDLSFAGSLPTNFRLEKRGAGELELRGNSGAFELTLTEGAVYLGSEGAIGPGAVGFGLNRVRFSGGILRYSGANQIDYSSRIGQTDTSVYRVDTNGANVTWAHVLHSGSLVKSGTGTLTLTSTGNGLDNYAGETRIDGGALEFDYNIHRKLVGNISGAGRLVKSGAGTLFLDGVASYSGPTEIRGGALAFRNDGNQTLSGSISGPGDLIKVGAGILTLLGDNTFTGTTSVGAGTLVLSGADRSPVHDIAKGAVLELNVASGTRDGAVNTRFSGQGTLRKTGAGESVWTGSAATFAMGQGSLIDIQGGRFGGGSFGNDVWLFNASRLRVASGATFAGTEANVRVDGIDGAGTVTSGFAGAGYTSFTMGVANGSGDFSGVLANSDAAHIGNYVKVGTGTQTLRGASTFTGGLSIEGGTLALAGGNNRLPTAITVLIRNGATLDLGGQVQALTGLGTRTNRVVGNLGAGRLDVSNGVFLQSGRVDASLQGSGSSYQQRLWIGGDASATVLLNGTNDMVFTADHNQVIIGHTDTGSAGTVRVGHAQALAAATEGVQVFNGTLDLNGVAGVRARDISLLSGGASLVNNGAGTASFANGVVLGTYQGFLGGSGNLMLTGVVSGSGGIRKTGAGTLVLAGNNTYAGPTSLLAGDISVASTGNLGRSYLEFAGGTLTNTQDMVLNRAVVLLGAGGTFNTAGGYLTLVSTAGGAGGLSKEGNNILTLSGTQAYLGATTVNAGLLKFSASSTAASSVSSASFAVAAGATLVFSDSQTVAAPITGAGALVHEFGGTTTLTGAATHTGGTSVIGGTIQVGNGGSSGALTGNVALSGGGTLAFNRRDDVRFDGAISGTGGLVKRGAGVLTLTGVNTFSGMTTVQSGELRLSGSAVHGAVTVVAGARLSGTGEVGALTVAGVLAPGDSPGLLTAGATTFASGGRYLWEINDSLGKAGVGYDTLAVTGALAISATLANPFTVSLRSLSPDNSAGLLSGFDARQSHRYTLVTTTDGILGFTTDSFRVDTTGFGNALQGGQWSLATSGNGLDLVFQAAAVPEPQSAALLLAGLAGLSVMVRGRRRRG